jgi:lipopolysaccharide/colanic/teichoic acid biosynthesis glycosyltransferase
MQNTLTHQQRGFSLFLKRCIDIMGALIVLILMAPILLVIAMAILCTMGRPVFFVQPRPGKDGQIFNFYKLRTMTDACDAHGNRLPDAERLTKLGQFLRKTSLDEFPQFFNVLKGELSIVGPRPLLVEYLPRYSPEQARRHEVIPGITGWAQVNGRNAISWDEKFRLDVWYVDNWSFWLDIKIMALTALKVIRRDGISQSGQATMEKFSGNTPKRMS